ncbi:uncharacterized protein ACIB01_008982 isoform 1-T1 [Guaruba guarouba]
MSINQSGTPDGTLSAWLQDPLRTGLPRALGQISLEGPLDSLGSLQEQTRTITITVKKSEQEDLPEIEEILNQVYLGVWASEVPGYEITGGQQELGAAQKEATCQTP